MIASHWDLASNISFSQAVHTNLFLDWHVQSWGHSLFTAASESHDHERPRSLAQYRIATFGARRHSDLVIVLSAPRPREADPLQSSDIYCQSCIHVLAKARAMLKKKLAEMMILLAASQNLSLVR